jgi:hypothetical protein
MPDWTVIDRAVEGEAQGWGEGGWGDSPWGGAGNTTWVKIDRVEIS